MPPESNLTLKVRDTEAVTIRAKFEDEEWKCLGEFVRDAEELDSTPVVQGGFATSLKIVFAEGNGLTIEAKAPPIDAVRLFLHKLRPFILENEPASFYRVAAILDRRYEHEAIRAVVASHRRCFSTRQAQSLFTINLNGTIINSDETLMKWLNAHEYHRDQDKQKELVELNRAFPAEALKTILISLLVDKAQSIFALADFIRCVIGKQKEHSISVSVPIRKAD